MLKRTSTPAKKNLHVVDFTEECSKSVNTSNHLGDILIRGKDMNDDEFGKFVKIHAMDCYWKILAERARIQLEDQLRENRQLHEILHELTQENEQLQMKTEQSEYLTNILNSIISEYDSGIELHGTDESPASKRHI